VIEAADPLMVLRMFRLLRLARAVRLLVQFRTLWKMVRGLLSSAGTMFYTCVITVLMLFIFSCAAVELITKNRRTNPVDALYDPEWEELVDKFYPGIAGCMLTLIQFVVLDSISELYMPLVRQDPLVLVFFASFIVVVSVSLMNLVTAVIVEVSLEQAKQDHESERMAQVSRVLPRLRDVFFELDRDGNGQISMEEVDQANPEHREELLKLVQADNLQELFDMLDVDNSGEVDIDEFLEGIVKVVTTSQPVEFIRVMKQLSLSRQNIHDLRRQIQRLEDKLLPSKDFSRHGGRLDPNRGAWKHCGAGSTGTASLSLGFEERLAGTRPHYKPELNTPVFSCVGLEAHSTNSPGSNHWDVSWDRVSMNHHAAREAAIQAERPGGPDLFEELKDMKNMIAIVLKAITGCNGHDRSDSSVSTTPLFHSTHGSDLSQKAPPTFEAYTPMLSTTEIHGDLGELGGQRAQLQKSQELLKGCEGDVCQQIGQMEVSDEFELRELCIGAAPLCNENARAAYYHMAGTAIAPGVRRISSQNAALGRTACATIEERGPRKRGESAPESAPVSEPLAKPLEAVLQLEATAPELAEGVNSGVGGQQSWSVWSAARQERELATTSLPILLGVHGKRSLGRTI